jgi:Rad3-related DNA helicase
MILISLGIIMSELNKTTNIKQISDQHIDVMNREYLDYFPKKSPYPNQLDAMDAIYGALEKRQIVLFEGACGTGKTLSALTPALYIAKKEKKTVVIATNVDEQMYQFIEEAKEIKKQKDIKVIVFKGKKKMCPLQMDYDKCNTLKENTYKLIDLEKEIEHLKEEIKEISKKLQHDKDNSLIEHQKFLSFEIDQNEISITELRKNSCDKLLELLKHDKGFFYDWVFNTVRTPEEILDWASANNCCGYELLKKFIKEVDLLICNYNHFIDEELRANVIDLLDKKLEDIILIFDEAHNILNNARDKSPKLTETDIRKAIDEIYSKRETLFCWDEVPGKDEDKFKKHLNECFCIDWIDLPKISKSENKVSINITDGNKTFCFELDTVNNDVKLVSDNILYKYYTKKDENQLKVYRFPEPSKDFGAFLSAFKDTIRSKYIDPIKYEIINTDWEDIQITKKSATQERIDTFKIELLSALSRHGIKNYVEVIERMKNFGAIIDDSNNRQAAEVKEYIKIKRRSKISQIADFISNYMAFSDDIYYYPVINAKRNENDIVWRLELYSCIPTNITGPLFDGVHSAVLMSATLTPFEDIKMMLGIKRETCNLAYPTTFPKEKRLYLVPVEQDPI